MTDYTSLSSVLEKYSFRRKKSLLFSLLVPFYVEMSMGWVRFHTWLSSFQKLSIFNLLLNG